MSPSFYVLTVAPGRFDSAEIVVSRLVKHSAGRSLTPVRPNQYVLSRAALLEIRAGRSDAEVLKVLRRIPGVTAVRRLRGDEVAELLRTRPSVPPSSKRTPESRQCSGGRGSPSTRPAGRCGTGWRRCACEPTLPRRRSDRDTGTRCSGPRVDVGSRARTRDSREQHVGVPRESARRAHDP